MRCGHFIKSLHLFKNVAFWSQLSWKPSLKWSIGAWQVIHEVIRGSWKEGGRSTRWGRGGRRRGCDWLLTVTAVSKGTLFCCNHPSSPSGGQDAVCYAPLLSEVQLLDFPGLGCIFSWPSSVPRAWDRMQNNQMHILKVRCHQCTESETHALWGWEQRGTLGTWHRAHRHRLQLLFSSNYHYVSNTVLKQSTHIFSFSNTAPHKAGVMCLNFIKEGVEDSCTHAQSLSHVRLFAIPWTAAHQAPLSKGFPRQEHWSGLPFPSPGNLPGTGIEPTFPAVAGRFFTMEPPGKPQESDYWLLLSVHVQLFKKLPNCLRNWLYSFSILNINFSIFSPELVI